MKKTLLLWLFGLLLTAQVFAQNRTLSGTVKDEKGEALIGVNVTGKGTTIGTVTDIDGKYTLELPKDVTALVFSYVTYTTIEKPILSLKVDAIMTSSDNKIEEVVVTAVAIKKEKRTLTTANNTVKSEDFNKGATDVFGALQSKAPGVRINNTSGQMGGSTRVVLRGESSLGGENNALFVVNGIPIDNNVSNGREPSSGGFIDFGNRALDINPDDIESINVLKGPAAVALYGSRGSGGVILITTKSGQGLSKADKKFNVTVNTGVTFDKAYLQIKRQDQFGQGYNNNPDPIENFSWGPAFDGVVRPWTPAISTPNGTSQLIRPYSAVKNQIQDALNTGITYKSGISVEGATDKFTYFLSYGNTTNKGIFPNTFYKKNSVSANATAKLADNLTSSFNIQYANTNQRQITGAGSSNFDGPFQALLQQAINIPINELRDYNSIYQDQIGYYAGYTANPYFLMDKTNNDNKADNLLASMEIEYKPVSFISLLGRVGTNLTLSNIYIKNPKYTYPRSTAKGLGYYEESNDKRNNLNIDLLATFNKSFLKKKTLNVTITGGYNFNEQRRNFLQGWTNGGLIVPDFYDLRNSVSQSVSRSTASIYRILGLYATASIGYKNLIFVDYTARNDWSSTLPKGNNGYFYQAGGVSFIPTEFIKPESKLSEWINYVKIRGNVGTQGKDAGLYLLNSTFDASPNYNDYSDNNLPVSFPVIGLDGSTVSGFTLGNRIGNPNLKPEVTFSYEIGADLDLLKNYLHVEYTYYVKKSKDLIVDVSLPASSGFAVVAKNVGKMNNVGHELLTKLTILRKDNKKMKGLNWDVRFQFAKNDNKVIKVSDESKELSLNTGGIQVVAKEGLPFGTFKALDFKRDEAGHIVVDATGKPVASTEYAYLGSYQPKYTMGFGSTLSWKGLSFDVQFDLRNGGQFYSGTKAATDFNGTSLSSLVNNRQPYVVPNSVVDISGGAVVPQYVENTTPLTNLYQYAGDLPESQNIIDASYIKLKEASVSYTFDKKFFKSVPITSISISLIGKNLKYWLPAENVYADPESNSFGFAGNVQGLEFSSVPTTRSVGFDFKIKF